MNSIGQDPRNHQNSQLKNNNPGKDSKASLSVKDKEKETGKSSSPLPSD